MSGELAYVSPNSSKHESVRKQDDEWSFVQGAPLALSSILPRNFAEVVEGVYRSAFPGVLDLDCHEILGIRTIINLVNKPYCFANQFFIYRNSIRVHYFSVPAHKDPDVKTPDEITNCILQLLLDRANHPVLVHCNKGKHRTGCIVGCFRKLQGWEHEDIIEEYEMFATLKARYYDAEFIREFDTSVLEDLAEYVGAPDWEPTDRLNVDETMVESPSPSPPLVFVPDDDSEEIFTLEL